jgi:hypothetical protein
VIYAFIGCGMPLNSRARFAVNGEPASSNVAAQIVNNHEAATPERRAEDRNAFGHLLQEILSNPGAESPDKNLSCKLVTVMAEAGLGAITKELRDPFVDREQLFSQATDSISVIELVIQKYPELLVDGNGSEPHNTSQGRLFLYLLPKILCLFSHEQCQPLAAVLTKLLSYLIEVALRNVDLWHHGLTFISIYRCCVECTRIPPYVEARANLMKPFSILWILWVVSRSQINHSMSCFPPLRALGNYSMRPSNSSLFPKDLKQKLNRHTKQYTLL